MGEGGGVGPGALGSPGGALGRGLGWGRVARPLVPIGPIDPFKGIPVVDPHLYGSTGYHFVASVALFEHVQSVFSNEAVAGNHLYDCADLKF